MHKRSENSTVSKRVYSLLQLLFNCVIFGCICTYSHSVCYCLSSKRKLMASSQPIAAPGSNTSGTCNVCMDECGIDVIIIFIINDNVSAQFKLQKVVLGSDISH